ncbi:MAG: hypothetical protein Q9186_002510 [Xanthomendoza sp. 1 TL-2023]
MAKKPQAFGPQPTNTLARDVPTSRPSVNHGLHRMRQGRRELDTFTSAGSNVRCSTLEFISDSPSSTEPRSKRQKVDHPHNSQHTPRIIDGSDDADQLLLDDNVLEVRHVIKLPEDEHAEIKKRSISQGTSHRTERNGFGGTQSREFYGVEEMMGSSIPNSKQRKKQQLQTTRNASATAESSFASSPSDADEMLNMELVTHTAVKPAYKGTANLHPPRRSQPIRGSFHGRSTADRSPYFPPPTSTKSINVDQNPRDSEGRPSSTRVALRGQPRDEIDKPSGEVHDTSSDELGAAEPDSRALSPVKPVRSQSPTKLPHSSPIKPASPVHELGPRSVQGNIKPSTFTKTANNGTRSKIRTYQGSYPDEKLAPWSIPLRAYNWQGERYANDGLGLVYNDGAKSYDIHCWGSNLASRDLALRIQPRKLQRIRWERDGTKMRFESSKTGSVDNVLDIELDAEEDVQLLTAVLQEGVSINVKGESGERMDLCFDHRLQQQRTAVASRGTSTSRQPTDIELASLRIERADKRRLSGEHRQHNPKRSRIVDTLRSQEQAGNKPSGPLVHSHRRKIAQTHDNATVKEKLEALDEVDVSPLDNLLKLQERNYQLRSQNSSGSLITRPREISPLLSNEDIQRYSKIHGLGKPWPKPLVYPKVGKKRTTVDWKDLERLDEGEFLNDNLIAFYLRYLEYQAEQADPTLSRKVYMFNSFFYDKLTSTKAGNKGINYDAVERWTRGIDIFTFDFVVVPVNESAHWYVAIICNLPALKRKLGGLDDDLAQGLGSPDEDGFDQTTKDKSVLPSTPPTATSGIETRDIIPSKMSATEDSKEHETAASFAEMSLEANRATINKDEPSPAIPGAFHSDDPVQDLLDCQLQYPVNGITDRQDQKLQEPQSPGCKEDEIIQMEKSTSPRSKHGKRKSLPSPRMFDPSKPTILTFDSFGTAHSSTIKVLKQYLREEANKKRGQMEFDEKELQGATAKQIPQQHNFCDCGLFLLGYMEKFFDNPREFINKVMRKEWDVQKDWPRLEPSGMRANMRGLLMTLEERQRQEFLDAKRPKATSKASKGPISSPVNSVGKSRPPNIDGANEAEKTPPKAVSNPSQQAPISTIKAAFESSAELGEPVQQASSPPKKAALEPALPILKAGRQEISHAESKVDFERLRTETEVAAITTSPETRSSERDFQMPFSHTTIPGKEAAADANSAPPAPTEEPPPQSFVVPDSQSESSNAPQNPEKLPYPESLAISPNLPSTIQDSQPPLPTIPLKDMHHETTPPPPPPSKARRHIDSFSSPPPDVKPTRDSKVERKSPRTPKTSYANKTAQSSPEAPRSKKRPILGARVPVVVGTDPKVVIQIDD